MLGGDWLHPHLNYIPQQPARLPAGPPLPAARRWARCLPGNVVPGEGREGKGRARKGRALRPAGRAGSGAMDKLKRVLSGRDAEEPSGLAEVALPGTRGEPGTRPGVPGAVVEQPARSGGGRSCPGSPSAAPRSRCLSIPLVPGQDRAQRFGGSVRARWEARVTSKQVSLLFLSPVFPGYRCDFLELGHPSEGFRGVFRHRMPVLHLGKEFFQISPISEF